MSWPIAILNIDDNISKIIVFSDYAFYVIIWVNVEVVVVIVVIAITVLVIIVVVAITVLVIL